MASSTAASIGKDKISGIGANGKDHIAGMIANGSIGMRGEIIEQHIAGELGLLGGRGLVVGDFVQGDDNGGVTTARVVEKETGDLLNSFDTEFIEKRGDVGCGELRFLTVDWSCPAMWSMLRFERRGMAQSEKSFWNIVGHGDVNVTGIVIPVDLEPEVTGPRPVFCERVASGESSKKMISIGFGKELDAEIVDGKGESGWTVGMPPKTRSVRDGEVTEGREMSLELVVRENGGFLETVHTLADFDIDVTFGIEVFVGQVVFGEDLGGEITTVNAHVLVDKHVRDQEEIFQVAGAVAGTATGIGDDTVDVEFGVGETDSWRTYILISIEAIAANRHSDSENLGFAGAHGADEVGISDLAARWDLVRFDKNHGVVASDLLADGARFCETLSAAPPLVGERSVPNERVGAVEESIDGFSPAGVRIIHFASNRWVVLDGLHEWVATMGTWIEAMTGETSTGAFARERRSEAQRERLGKRDRGQRG